MGCRFIFFKSAGKRESEGVTLALEPSTKYTTHICNEASQPSACRARWEVRPSKVLGIMDVIATTGVDTFENIHRNLEGENLAHVHFVDGNPGGHLVPGDGNPESGPGVHTPGSL